ncbi:MAG: zinc-binding dehydrogenase [Bacillota bacterium]|nr:zinc-binding dehydrogenase [Bacillota bacterium]
MSDIPKKAKVMVTEQYNEPFVLKEVDIPEVKAGDILVKVQLAGTCGTDIHEHAGHLPPHLGTAPFIQGHETIGKIAKLGEGVVHDVAGTPVKEGDRILWAHQFCGECYACKIMAEPYMCEKPQGYGFAAPERLRGGFAEYELVTAGTDFVRIPDIVTDEAAIGVGCAFRTVINAFEKLNKHGGIIAGDNVVVQGCGPVGLYSALMAANTAASKVIVVGSPATRLEVAKKWGATDVINIDEVTDAAERDKMIKDMTDGRGADVVIECSGFGPAFTEGCNMLAKTGTYLIVGMTGPAKVEFMPNIFLNKQLTMIGSGSADIRHFYKALKFMESHWDKYPFELICSGTYALEDAYEALENMKAGKEIKACIDCRNR